MGKSIKEVKKNKRWLSNRHALLILIAVLLLVVFKDTTKKIFFFVVFLVLNSALAILKKLIDLPIEIEAKTFGIVMLTSAYGLGIGGIFILVASFFQILLRQRFNTQMIMEIFTDFILAYITIALPVSSIITLGAIISLLNLVFIFIFLNFIFAVPMPVTIMACFSNILFNLLLFNMFGVPLSVLLQS